MKICKNLTFAPLAVGGFQSAAIVVAAAALLALSTRSVFAQPTISLQPANFSISVGANVTFIVTAGGSTLGYQWWFNNGEIAGQTNRTLVLTNGQPADAGSYSVIVSDSGGSTPSNPGQLAVDATFTKITTGDIATDRSAAWGCGWGDYDNDGYIDLVVGVNDLKSGINGLSLMYRNNGDGTFTKITNNITTLHGDSEPLWGDYDNDGFLDLFMVDANYAATRVQRLYHNNGNGTFTNITSPSFPGTTVNAGNAAWGDYDNDGFLDLILPNDNGAKVLFRNNGNGTFTRMTSSAVGELATDIGAAICAAWADYDDDGNLDVLFTQENGPNKLYRNNGDGTFTLVPVTEFGNKTTASMGAAWEDFFNRGHLDLFIVNGRSAYRQNNFYFRNNGDGTFTAQTTNEVGDVVADASPGYGCAAADYDNDGYLDLFVTNPGIGMPGPPEPNLLYHNNGNGTFSRVMVGSLTSDAANSTSASWSDYNNDGFMDLVVANGAWGGYNGPQPIFLYRNNGNTNHWLTLKLVGTVSNRSAIGAKVRVKATLGGQAIWQMRQISSASGFCDQNDLRPHFGLRDATVAETVRIEWPSGTVQELHNVAADQFLTVTEPARLGSQITQSNGIVELQIKSWKGFVYGVEASSNLNSWIPLTTFTNDTGVVSFPDPEAGSATHRFYRAVTH